MIDYSSRIRAINQIYPGFFNMHKDTDSYYENKRAPDYFMKQFEEVLAEVEERNAQS